MSFQQPNNDQLSDLQTSDNLTKIVKNKWIYKLEGDLLKFQSNLVSRLIKFKSESMSNHLAVVYMKDCATIFNFYHGFPNRNIGNIQVIYYIHI